METRSDTILISRKMSYRNTSKRRDLCLEFLNSCNIYQARGHHCDRDTSHISKQYAHFKIQTHGFKRAYDKTSIDVETVPVNSGAVKKRNGKDGSQ